MHEDSIKKLEAIETMIQDVVETLQSYSDQGPPKSIADIKKKAAKMDQPEGEMGAEAASANY